MADVNVVNPNIFKAYDVRGLYPSEVNETAAHDIGGGFVTYLGARRIAVTRDMRTSSPGLAEAFIEGARQQGCDVIDYGMLPTDVMYFAVCRDGLDGGAQITASHNPKQYNGIKLVARDAKPLSGDIGLKEIREMIMARELPPSKPAMGATSAARSSTTISSTSSSSSTRRSSSRSTVCSMPAAAWAA